MDRLQLLQEEELAWVRRYRNYNISLGSHVRDNLERFDRQKFDRDVSTERTTQNQNQEQREAATLLEQQQVNNERHEN